MSLRPEERKARQNFVSLATRIHPDATLPNILRLSVVGQFETDPLPAYRWMSDSRAKPPSPDDPALDIGCQEPDSKTC
jgi:hypothetical protein